MMTCSSNSPQSDKECLRICWTKKVLVFWWHKWGGMGVDDTHDIREVVLMLWLIKCNNQSVCVGEVLFHNLLCKSSGSRQARSTYSKWPSSIMCMRRWFLPASSSLSSQFAVWCIWQSARSDLKVKQSEKMTYPPWRPSRIHHQNPVLHSASLCVIMRVHEAVFCPPNKQTCVI